MEIKSPARHNTQGSNEADGQSFPRFEIANLSAVEYGRIRWTFDLQVGPITLECRVIVDEDGQPKFVAPAAVKEAYSQSYRSTVTLDRTFAREVFNDIVARLQPTAEPATASRRPRVKGAPAPGWAEEQEARFERASAEMDAVA